MTTDKTLLITILQKVVYPDTKFVMEVIVFMYQNNHKVHFELHCMW